MLRPRKIVYHIHAQYFWKGLSRRANSFRQSNHIQRQAVAANITSKPLQSRSFSASSKTAMKEQKTLADFFGQRTAGSSIGAGPASSSSPGTGGGKSTGALVVYIAITIQDKSALSVVKVKSAAEEDTRKRRKLVVSDGDEDEETPEKENDKPTVGAAAAPLKEQAPVSSTRSSTKSAADSTCNTESLLVATTITKQHLKVLPGESMDDTDEQLEGEDIVDEKEVEQGKLSNTYKTLDWKKDGPIPFKALSKTFELIEATTKRLIILDIMTDLFVHVIHLSPDQLLPVVYLCINKLAPTWEGLELGIGESLLIKAIAEATGRSSASIKTDLKELGDLGAVAQASRSKQRTMFQPKLLTVQAVFKTLKEIAGFSGHSSMSKKVDRIRFLLVSCRENEAKYLIRALEGKLRIGLAEQTVLVALAHASVLAKTNEKKSNLESKLSEATEILKQVYSELPMYEKIIPVLLEKDIFELPKLCRLTPGIPLKPMLAHPTKAITEVLDRFENIPFTCEYKYDGERAQIHQIDSGQMMIFSRNQENMSEKYPDIMEAMKLVPKEGVNSFVLDSEAVAWDREKHVILPFQVLSTRKRKDVNTDDIKVQVCVFAFDLLYLNGESLIKLPLSRRRDLLRESFNEIEGKFCFAKHMDSQKIEDIQIFLDESIHGNCEGLMVKTLEKESSYEPSKRSRNWLKVKKDYLEGAGDSLDLVVIGGYIGKGKRTGGYGGFLLACYDDDREEYQAICKIGTGFSDDDLQKHSQFFKTHEIQTAKPYYSYGEGVKPDVWFDAVQVWEVKTADLSISPIYTAGVGLVDSGKGISLRFPRFIRIRDDKAPELATTASQVADMYRQQKINHGYDNSAAVDEDY